MSSSQFNLNVLLVFLCVRRIDFCVFCSYECLKQIVGKSLGLVERYFHIAIEFFSERIAIIDSENSLEEIDIDCNVEIFPCVVVSKLSNDFRYFLSFQKDSLRNTWILDLLFSDINGFIRKIVIDKDRSDSIVFKSAFYNVLLEIRVESQHFSIILEPRRLNTWDVIVLWCLSWFLKA